MGSVISGYRYPEEAAVSAATLHGTLGTFMEIEVKVDTEDLLGPGWLIADSGLWVPRGGELTAGEIFSEVSSDGLTKHQLYKHQLVQARQITEIVAS